MQNQSKLEAPTLDKMDKKEQSRNPFLDTINESDESKDSINETESTCMRTFRTKISHEPYGIKRKLR